MALSGINIESVEAALKARRSGKPMPPDLLAFQWGGRTPVENALALEDLLHEAILSAYAQHRRIEGLPPAQPATRQEALDQIQADFATGSGELQAWSALAFRYGLPADISVDDLARAASVVPQQLRRKVNQGLELLAQQVRRKARAAQPGPASLPLPEFTALVGAKAKLDQMLRLFNDPSGPRLVSLEGLGGIGKTALARAFVSLPETTARWDGVYWVSARQSALAEDGQIRPVSGAASTLEDVSARLCEQMDLAGLAGKPLPERLEGLHAALERGNYLVVIDNLETVEEYEQLVPAAARLAGRSRFLITTRQTLRGFPFVHAIVLQELESRAANELVRAESERRGRALALDPGSFEALYQVVGGLPLALKLAAAQLSLRPLPAILDGFRQARAGADGVYRYLYWQSWRSLSDDSRRLLLSFLPADPEGEDLDFLSAMSGLPEDGFYKALNKLDQFSLLETNGDAARPLYRLHRLTVTFLQTDILNRWAQGGGDEHPTGE